MKSPLCPRPSPLPLATQLLSSLIRLPLFLVGTAACGTASLAASMFENDGSAQHRIARLWARFSVWVSGSRVKVVGASNVRHLPAAVYCSNHLSFMDTPAIFSSLPFQFRIVARSSLWNVPFIGWHLHRSGQIPVNVDNPRASVASLSGGVRTLRAGMPLFIFPEGGRSKDGHSSMFMNGPAFMAIRAKVPIVPMALVGTYELLPMGAWQFFPSPITLAIGEAVETTSYSIRDVEKLTQELQEAVSHLYYQHSYLQPARSSETANSVR